MSRRICKPIYESDELVIMSNPLPICKPLDIVIDDSDDSDVEDIELKVNESILATEVEFWAFISEIRWTDKTARTNTGALINTLNSHINKLSKKSFDDFRKHVEYYSDSLAEIFETHKVFQKLERSLDKKQQELLIRHIVLRGQQFYNTILSDPLFVGYLVRKVPTMDEFVAVEFKYTNFR